MEITYRYGKDINNVTRIINITKQAAKHERQSYYVSLLFNEQTLRLTLARGQHLYL